MHLTRPYLLLDFTLCPCRLVKILCQAFILEQIAQFGFSWRPPSSAQSRTGTRKKSSNNPSPHHAMFVQAEQNLIFSRSSMKAILCLVSLLIVQAPTWISAGAVGCLFGVNVTTDWPVWNCIILLLIAKISPVLGPFWGWSRVVTFQLKIRNIHYTEYIKQKSLFQLSTRSDPRDLIIGLEWRIPGHEIFV